jgi:hypothetical protein
MFFFSALFYCLSQDLDLFGLSWSAAKCARQQNPKQKSTGAIPRRSPKVVRPHLPGSRLGLVGAASSWASRCPRGGRTPSPLASSSAGKDSREAAKACMPAWARMADQRLMRDVVVVCCDGAGTARALCCASKRRKSADS